MAVTDLWVDKTGQPTKRYGRGLRWRAAWRGRAEHYRTKRAAEHAELRMRQAEETPRVDATVGELVEVWLKGKRHLSRKGFEGCHGAAQHVLARWRDVDAGDITGPDAQAWISALACGANLKHKIAQALSGTLEVGVQLAVLRANPAAHLRVGRETRREGIFLTVDQVADLADAAHLDSLDFAPMVWLMATTGARLGEAVALDVADVDPSRRRIRVRTSKNGLARDLPISGAVLAMLPTEPGPLFRGVRDERVNAGWWRRRIFHAARDAIDVPDLHPHDLRHTAVSLAISSGADVKVVQRMAGHKSATVTLDVYGHLLDASLDDVAERLGLTISASGVLTSRKFATPMHSHVSSSSSSEFFPVRAKKSPEFLEVPR